MMKFVQITISFFLEAWKFFIYLWPSNKKTEAENDSDADQNDNEDTNGFETHPAVTQKCDVCGSEEELPWFCVDCGEKLCGFCKSAHMKSTRTKFDNIITLSQAQQDLCVIRVLSYCDVHLKKQRDVYCISCETAICVECLLDSHKLHDCKMLSEVLPSIKERLLNMKKDISLESQFMKTHFSKERQRSDKYKIGIQNIKTLVSKHYQDFINDVLKIRDEQLATLTQLQSIEISRLIASRVFVKNTIKEMLKDIEKEEQKETPDSMVNIRKRIQLQLSEVLGRNLRVKLPRFKPWSWIVTAEKLQKQLDTQAAGVTLEPLLLPQPTEVTPVLPRNGTFGSDVKFNPPISRDTMVKKTVSTTVNTRHQCIVAMREYQHSSLEELRHEDYLQIERTKNKANTSSGVGTDTHLNVSTSGTSTISKQIWGFTFETTSKPATEASTTTMGHAFGTTSKPANKALTTTMGHAFGTTSKPANEALTTTMGHAFGTTSKPATEASTTTIGHAFGTTSKPVKEASTTTIGHTFGTTSEPATEASTTTIGHAFGTTSKPATESSKTTMGHAFGTTSKPANEASTKTMGQAFGTISKPATEASTTTTGHAFETISKPTTEASTTTTGHAFKTISKPTTEASTTTMGHVFETVSKPATEASTTSGGFTFRMNSTPATGVSTTSPNFIFGINSTPATEVSTNSGVFTFGTNHAQTTTVSTTSVGLKFGHNPLQTNTTASPCGDPSTEADSLLTSVTSQTNGSSTSVTNCLLPTATSKPSRDSTSKTDYSTVSTASKPSGNSTSETDCVASTTTLKPGGDSPSKIVSSQISTTATLKRSDQSKSKTDSVQTTTISRPNGKSKSENVSSLKSTTTNLSKDSTSETNSLQTVTKSRRSRGSISETGSLLTTATPKPSVATSGADSLQTTKISTTIRGFEIESDASQATFLSTETTKQSTEESGLKHSSEFTFKEVQKNLANIREEFKSPSSTSAALNDPVVPEKDLGPDEFQAVYLETAEYVDKLKKAFYEAQNSSTTLSKSESMDNVILVKEEQHLSNKGRRW